MSNDNVRLKVDGVFGDLIYTRNLPHVCKREECTGGYTQKCWVVCWSRNNGGQGDQNFVILLSLGSFGKHEHKVVVLSL